jgi:hypothetical protein
MSKAVKIFGYFHIRRLSNINLILKIINVFIQPHPLAPSPLVGRGLGVGLADKRIY